MKRRKSVPAGYMDALGKLYGRKPIAGPEMAPGAPQSAPAVSSHHSAKGERA